MNTDLVINVALEGQPGYGAALRGHGEHIHRAAFVRRGKRELLAVGREGSERRGALPSRQPRRDELSAVTAAEGLGQRCEEEVAVGGEGEVAVGVQRREAVVAARHRLMAVVLEEEGQPALRYGTLCPCK